MARDTNEYVTLDISEKPFNECCDEKVSYINSKFDTIVEKINERRQQLIKSVELLKREYSSWKEHIGKLKRQTRVNYSNRNWVFLKQNNPQILAKTETTQLTSQTSSTYSSYKMN